MKEEQKMQGRGAQQSFLTVAKLLMLGTIHPEGTIHPSCTVDFLRLLLFDTFCYKFLFLPILSPVIAFGFFFFCNFPCSEQYIS